MGPRNGDRKALLTKVTHRKCGVIHRICTEVYRPTANFDIVLLAAGFRAGRGDMSITFFNGDQLKALAASDQPFVRPFNYSAVQPASIDLRLSNKLFSYNIERYDISSGEEPESFEENYDSLELDTGKVAFIGIAETIEIPEDVVGFIFPRSSISRLGINICPIYMNPGYRGKPPLTIVNNAPFKISLVPNAYVAQLVCARLSSAPELTYRTKPSAKYQDEDAYPSRIHSDETVQKAMKRILMKEVPSVMKHENV